MRQLFCPIRAKWVAAAPEEIVRQKLIQKMISELGFPKGLIAVEKEIASMPNRSSGFDPKRRLDLVCYAAVKGDPVPLLLAECKAVSLNEAAARQAFGYNAAIGAPFVCLASPLEIKTLWVEKGEIASVPFLPAYSELVKVLCC